VLAKHSKPSLIEETHKPVAGNGMLARHSERVFIAEHHNHFTVEDEK
jgi:hypothetical protein